MIMSFYKSTTQSYNERSKSFCSQDQAKRLLKQLGSSAISWNKIEEQETLLLLQIVQVIKTEAKEVGGDVRFKKR